MRRNTALKRGKRLAPKSKKRIQADTERAAIRLQVFERDDYTCRARFFDQLGPCFGPPTPHHLLKASQGGSYSLDNLITLCAAHNRAVEDFPTIARSLGLVRFSSERGLQEIVPQAAVHDTHPPRVSLTATPTDPVSRSPGGEF